MDRVTGSTAAVSTRVWDSFTLTGPSILQSLRWFGLPSDALTLGVNVQIANAPNSSPSREFGRLVQNIECFRAMN